VPYRQVAGARNEEQTMIELSELPGGVVRVRPVGTVTAQDYAVAIAPLIAEAGRGRRLRCLVEAGPDFRGITPGAAWADVRLGLRAMRAFDGCAMVSDLGWVRRLVRAAAFWLPYPLRGFPGDRRDEAQAWLAALPAKASLVAQERDGVVVVEVGGPLHTEDIEALAGVVDPWLDRRPDRPGVVVHASRFPGWATAGALARHLRFVRDHQGRIGRVAVAVGGRAAPVMAGVVGRVARPEVRAFGPDEFDRAVEWAGQG
jgi:hypothetical protein